MRKLTIAVLAAALSWACFANDYYFYHVSGGNIIPAENNATNVEMREEIIVVELFDEYYKTTVDFSFYNNGDAEQLLVGFPYLYEGEENQSGIYDFKTWVNGALAEHANSFINPPENPSEREAQKARVNYAFTKNVQFAAKSFTQTKVAYNARYGKNGAYQIASYLYGSGKGWHGDIGKITIRIKNHTAKWIYAVNMPNMETQFSKTQNIDLTNKIRWNTEALEIMLQNIEPDETDIIEIQMGIPLFDFGPKILPQSFLYRTKVFEKNELAFLSKAQLRILRNLYYAFYGYDFKDKELKEYFLRQQWYAVNKNFSEALITETERKNIQIIQDAEKTR